MSHILFNHAACLTEDKAKGHGIFLHHYNKMAALSWDWPMTPDPDYTLTSPAGSRDVREARLPTVVSWCTLPTLGRVCQTSAVAESSQGAIVTGDTSLYAVPTRGAYVTSGAICGCRNVRPEGAEVSWGAFCSRLYIPCSHKKGWLFYGISNTPGWMDLFSIKCKIWNKIIYNKLW